MTKTHPHIKAQALRDVANGMRANGDTITAALIESAADMIDKQSADLAAAVEILRNARPLVDAMVGIGSSARFVISDIDEILARLDGGTKAEE